jgi:hypothetical protein
MKRFALLLSGFAGLLLGIVVSRSASFHRSAADGAASASAAVLQVEEAKPHANSAAGSDPASDRIARIFSALKEPVDLARRYALHEALRDLPAAEFPALLERAARVPRELQQDFIVALMIVWFEADPAAAGQWMLTHPEQAHGLEAWARADPEAAIRDALAAPGRARSKRLLFAAIEKIAGKEPAAQAARLRELPVGTLRAQVFADVLKKWAESDPRAALADVERMAPGGPRDDARKQVILQWAGQDPASALAQVPALLPTLKTQLIGNPFLTSLAERVMEKNPRVGLEWLERLPAEHRQAVAIAGLSAWAKQEPVAALQWGLEHGIEVGRGRRLALNSWGRGVLTTAAVQAPAAAFAALEALPAGPQRTGLLERALADLAWHLAPEKFAPLQAGLLQRVLPQLAPNAQRYVAGDIGQMIGAASSFTDAGAWSRLFPAGKVREAAVSSAFWAAYHADAKRGERLLATLAPSPERDAALTSAVSWMTDRDPAGAAGRALEIGDRQKRQKSLDAVLTTWRERDPGASEAWLREQATR